MIEGFRDFLGDISGYRPLYLATVEKLEVAEATIVRLVRELNEANEIIRQLQQLVPRPPPPEITYIRARDSTYIQGCIGRMKLGITRFPLDGKYRMTNQTNMLNAIAWDWVDKRRYIKDFFDCENFAIAFKAHMDYFLHLNQVGIVVDYVSGHSYNMVIFPDHEKVMLLEPQSDVLFCWTKRTILHTLEGSIVLI